MVPQKLIFEGVELAGKSFVISQIYNILEPDLTSGKKGLLDGCHWFNCDVGVFGTSHGKEVIKNYVNIAKELDDSHVIFEKFHLADQVYNKTYNNSATDYKKIEKNLKKLGFKIVFLHINDDVDLFDFRLKDRLNLYPHYERIAKEPEEYMEQQKTYKELIKESSLPVLEINSSKLPNDEIINKIIEWIKK